MELGKKIIDANALIISSPEYNGGISGVLKNAIDWILRMKPMPLADKHLLLLSASPGALGGVRGLWHTRVPLEALGVHVFPRVFWLPNAYEAFDEHAKLKNVKNAQNLTNWKNQV